MAASQPQPQPKYPPPPPPGPAPVSPGWQGGAPASPPPPAAYPPPMQPYQAQAQPYAYPAPPPAKTVSAQWGWSIVSLFFFLILGAIAVYYSSQVGARLRVGNLAGAEDASKKARIFAIAGIVVGILAIPILAMSGNA